MKLVGRETLLKEREQEREVCVWREKGRRGLCGGRRRERCVDGGREERCVEGCVWRGRVVIWLFGYYTVLLLANGIEKKDKRRTEKENGRITSGCGHIEIPVGGCGLHYIIIIFLSLSVREKHSHVLNHRICLLIN